jgi:hypothetical protein
MPVMYESVAGAAALVAVGVELPLNGDAAEAPILYADIEGTCQVIFNMATNMPNLYDEFGNSVDMTGADQGQ